MTDKEYIDNFNKLSQRTKHDFKSMMYEIKDGKIVNIYYTDSPDDKKEASNDS